MNFLVSALVALKPREERDISNTIVQKRMDLGLLGKLFGSKEHAPTNIAGMVIVGILVIGIALASYPSGQSSMKTLAEVRKILGEIE